MAGDKSDAEFQEFLQIEQQKAQLTGQVPTIHNNASVVLVHSHILL